MKTIEALALGIASSVGACSAAASLASFVMAEPQPQEVASLAAPDLWTTSPVRVDLSRQHYQRLPAAYSSYVTEAPKVATENPQPDPLQKKPELVPPGLTTAIARLIQPLTAIAPTAARYAAANRHTAYRNLVRMPASQMWKIATMKQPRRTMPMLPGALPGMHPTEGGRQQLSANGGPRRKYVPPSHADIESAQYGTRRY